MELQLKSSASQLASKIKRYREGTGTGFLIDGETALNCTTTIEQKQPHAWCLDASEAELLPYKKQAICAPNSNSSTAPVIANITTLKNSSNFSSTASQCNSPSHDLGPANWPKVSQSKTGMEMNSLSMTTKEINFLVNESSSAEGGELSVSHSSKDPRSVFATEMDFFGIEDDSSVLNPPVYNREDPMSARLIKCEGGSEISSLASKSMIETFNKVNQDGLCFGSINVKSFRDPIGNPGGSYNFFDQPSVHASGTPETGLDASKADAARVPSVASEISLDSPSARSSETRNTWLNVSKANAVDVALVASKTKYDTSSKGKSDMKTKKKETPNSFPPNVKSLLSTRVFDGVPVKYISSSRKELQGFIKDSGYLCGCQTCNFSKVLNAYEFEHHAGCKTKHPNSRIYFENGKTLYGIVQELRSVPENLLFEKIQTITGSAINQKMFCIWKESFQAATCALEQIHRKFIADRNI